jgi:hypothetical protein
MTTPVTLALPPAVVISPTGIQGPRGNAILNGTGAPTSTVGIDGDFYLDTTANNVYGPKAAGAWPGGSVHIGAAGALLAANNLSDLPSPANARTSLGLGTSATRNVGSSTGTVAAGDDGRLSDARTPTAHAASHASAGSDPVTAASIGAVPAAGGTVSGVLVIDRYGAAVGYPLGRTAAVESVSVPSSYAGGDDDGTGTDSTGRINLYSYQRANVRSFGETIRNFAMRSDAKSMQAFYMPVQTGTKKGGYSPTSRDPMTSGIAWQPVVWQGAHYEANDHGSIHGHWELEIADSTGALQGRLEIPFIDQATDGSKALDQAVVGVDYTNIRTNLADLSVRAQNITTGPYTGQTTCLRVGGGNDRVKDIRLSISSDMADSGRRWAIRANIDTESGANSGTNYQLLRYDDTGNQLGTAIFVQRSDGQITTGASSSKSARLAAVWATSGISGFSVQPSATIGSAAGFDAQMSATTERAFQTLVTGEANRRLVIYTDGKLEWGDGTTTRDTNLYRELAGQLRTDSALRVGTNLGVGASPSATARLTVTNSAAGQLAAFTRTATGDSAPLVVFLAGDTTTAQAIGVSVSGDAVNRFGLDPTGKLTWGDGTNARDAELYRSSANVLATDHWFRATQGLRINTTSLGGGVGVLAMANATTAPTSNPTGGVVMYVSNGRVKIRQPDGTDQFVALTAT